MPSGTVPPAGPREKKEKGWRSEFRALGGWKFSRRARPQPQICGAGTQPTALRFRSCGRAPSIHSACLVLSPGSQDAIRHKTASAFGPPGRDDDGLPASRASRNPTTPPYILPPVRADMMADLSGYWGPCALPASRRWDVALAVVGSRRYRAAKNPFSTRPGRRLQSATSATMLETWCHQAVETTNLSRRLQPPSREPGHARSPFRHPTRGNPRIMFPQARFLGHVLDTACARVGAGAAAGSRLIDGVEVPGLG